MTMARAKGARMTPKISVPDVCERDIDLLLLEEFVASADFRSWFLEQVGIENADALLDARRSVKTGRGESDIELVWKGKSGAIKVLIENKVDAPFTPNQPQRYAERADAYKSSGEYREVVTVIIAPEVYFGDDAEDYGFDASITYESVLAWFSDKQRTNSRTDYKLAILRGAIERGGSGWQLIPHPDVSKFWRSYWELAERIAPRLAMPVPKKDIPEGSSFIVFRPAALPSDVKLIHKVNYGHVDLQFSDMGQRLAEMERSYGATLLPGARIEKAAKSAVIRARVDRIDMTQGEFADKETVVRNALEAASALLDWYIKTQNRGRQEQRRKKTSLRKTS